MGQRADDALFTSLAVRAEDGCLSLVYKAAAEIGELGDNVAALRLAMAGDPLLARALASPDVRATVVGHTRWASVGPHLAGQRPSPQFGRGQPAPAGAASQRPYVVGALNGDIDNYAELKIERRRWSCRTRSPPTPSSCPRFFPGNWPRGEEAGRSFPPSGCPFRRVCRYCRQFGHCAGPAFPGSSRQRPKPQHRPGRRRLCSRQRALRAGRGDQPLFAHGRRKGRSGGDVLPGRCRHPGGDFPLPLRRHPAPGWPRRSDGGGNNDAGRGPPRLQAFPAERDFRIARIGAQDLARENRYRGKWPAFCPLGGRRHTRRRPPGSLGRPCPQHRGHRARHGGGSRAGRGLSHYEVPTSSERRGAAGDRGFGLGPDRFGATRRHVRGPGSGDQPIRDDHRHQPHRRPFAGQGRSRGGHCQPAQQRPRPKSPRRPLHLRWARRRDERGFHQGLLFAGNGGAFTGPRAGVRRRR